MLLTMALLSFRSIYSLFSVSAVVVVVLSQMQSILLLPLHIVEGDPDRAMLQGRQEVSFFTSHFHQTALALDGICPFRLDD